jgi:DNA-directed RNA polymerase subunit beta'
MTVSVKLCESKLSCPVCWGVQFILSLPYPTTFLVRPLTDQPRLIYMHLHKFWHTEMFYGTPWLQKLINRLDILDAPLECCSFSVKWRQVLANFLSRQWFQNIEAREMLTGTEAIYRLLNQLDLDQAREDMLDKWEYFNRYSSWEQYPIHTPTLNKFVNKWRQKIRSKVHFLNAAAQSRKNTIVKRLALLKKLSLIQSHPAWMVLLNLPVLPPDLRPIMKLKEGQIILSDLNELYRIIITRNLAIAQLSVHNLTAMVQKVLLQRAVDALLGNGLGITFRDLDNHPYKSIADMLSGKEGRLRENLLGKRVDYSGRSVIVVGPTLKLYQCGLPHEMAIELFQPFVIYYLIHFSLARSPRAAKTMIQKRSPVIWPLLKRVVQNHAIVLNRAPTLHRLGIQAFQPILVKERALQLHPLVCTGFNADFDGDQMAVHVPLSLEAQAEACILMSPYFNLLSPATGEAITVPSQDMLLGLYMLTLETNLGVYRHITRNIIPTPSALCSESTTSLALDGNQMNRDAVVWLAMAPSMKVNTPGLPAHPLECYYDAQGHSSQVYPYLRRSLDDCGRIVLQDLRTTLGRVLLNQHMEQARQVTVHLSQKR